MDEREAHLIADGVVAPDLRDVDMVVLAEPTRDIDHSCRNVEMKRRANLREMRPLRQRLEVIHGLARFDFDHDLKAVAPILGLEHEIGVQRAWAAADRGVLLHPWVHSRFVFPAKLRL